MIERPRKIQDSTRIARGKPSGVIILRFGSTLDTGIDIFPGSRKASIRVQMLTGNPHTVTPDSGVSSFLIPPKNRTVLKGSLSCVDQITPTVAPSRSEKQMSGQQIHGRRERYYLSRKLRALLLSWEKLSPHPILKHTIVHVWKERKNKPRPRHPEILHFSFDRLPC
jgi:hypothetical protein